MMNDDIEREVGEILSRLRYWQGYAKKAEDHAMVLAEQCEALQNENHELEHETDVLRNELMTAYDLIAEGLAQNSSYDYDARARAFVEKHTAR